MERISVRRIVSYDGQRLKYWYNDHKSGKRKMDDITVLENIALVKQSTSEKLMQDETRLLDFYHRWHG